VNLVRNSRGNVIGAIQLDRDVSQVHRLKNQLAHSESLADLGRSTAGMAHEIRKPLNGIKGFASLLQRVTKGEPADKYSSRIMEAAGRLDSMLENLLNFARPEDLDERAVDLRVLGERVAEFVDVEEIEDAPEVVISVDVSDQARFVLGDPRKLEQVLLNLVKNGVEAMESDGEVKITASRLQHKGDKIVEIGVHDTGKGIPAEKQEEILEPFTTNKDGGTGLGLAIVQKILRLHGTKINIDSQPGQGTTMKFYLPATEKGDQNDQ
jgi:signal transduction histidine kinase